MTARRYDLVPEPVTASDRYTAALIDGTQEVRLVTGIVPAAGHLGVQEVGCDGHLIGADGGYCLYCRAQV